MIKQNEKNIITTNYNIKNKFQDSLKKQYNFKKSNIIFDDNNESLQFINNDLSAFTYFPQKNKQFQIKVKKSENIIDSIMKNQKFQVNINKVLNKSLDVINFSVPFYNQTKKWNNKNYLRNQNNKKIIFIDGQNFKQKFLKIKDSDHTNLKFANNRIKRFMETLKNMGFEVYLFMDSYRKTDETCNKWRKRVNKQVTSEKKSVPIGHGQIMSEFFKKYGANLCFSFNEDNDDTMASYASALENIFILSADHDFYRYRYKYTPIIFNNFYYDKDDSSFINFDEDYNKRPHHNIKYRDVIVPLPDTRPFSPIINSLIKNKIWSRGVATKLCKEFGNFHIKIRKIRQALYYHLFKKECIELDKINSNLENKNLSSIEYNDLINKKKILKKKILVTEKFPTWNGNTVVWTTTDILPDKKEYYSIINNLKIIINKYFPNKYLDKIYSYYHKKYDYDLANIYYNNTIFSINAIIVEIKCLITNKTFLSEISKLYKFKFY